MANNCPHRGASMFFGRNEESGLRCVYHGWKFNTSGACVDMPNEPPESNFKHKVKITAYPLVEKGGVIWAYMGPENPAPSCRASSGWTFPRSSASAPSGFRRRTGFRAWKVTSIRVMFPSPHSFLDPTDAANISRGRVAMIRHLDRHPKFEVIDTDYGVCVGIRPNCERHREVMAGRRNT